MTGDYDSRLYCPHCSGGPALYLWAENRGCLRAQCPVCGKRYSIKRQQDGSYTMTIVIPPSDLLGKNTEAVLHFIVETGAVWDDELDRDTRRQMRKLEELGLVRSGVRLLDGRKKFFWEPTRRGLEHVPLRRGRK